MKPVVSQQELVYTLAMELTLQQLADLVIYAYTRACNSHEAKLAVPSTTPQPPARAPELFVSAPASAPASAAPSKDVAAPISEPDTSPEPDKSPEKEIDQLVAQLGMQRLKPGDVGVEMTVDLKQAGLMHPAKK